ncbi:MAG: HIT family protein [Bacteroidetes bacterium]|jgi:histidine triad (HIT) family protein|nr:HIT family protein [Bacteroidota bacterium]
MASIFSKIIAGELPCYKVYEDDKHFCFLDIRPVVKGHTLVIPKKEVDYIFDLNSDEYIELMMTARKIAKAMKKVIPCNRIGVAVVGLEVPHTHIHLMPINAVSDMNFKNPPITLSVDEFEQLAREISSAIE